MLLEGLQPKPTGSKRCKIALIFDDLEMGDRELLAKFLADEENWSSNGLADALRERGVFVSVHTILKHRKGKCAC